MAVNHYSVPEDMTGRDALEWGLSRLTDASYGPGYNGTCYECPFASKPLDRTGREVPFHEVANDPTEAHYRCTLPTREEAKRLAWGEYAPCTQEEWVGWLRGLLDTLALTDQAKRLISIFVPGLGGEDLIEWSKRRVAEMEAERCSSEKPCAEFNPEHLALWGECYVVEVRRT